MRRVYLAPKQFELCKLLKFHESEHKAADASYSQVQVLLL